MINFSDIENSIKQCAQSETDMPIEKVLTIRLMMHTVNGYLEHRNKLLKQWGLNDTLFMALAVLFTQPDYTIQPSKLSEILGSSRTNATRISDDLVERGWIERVMSPTDRRCFLLKLTEEGHEFINARLPKQWENINAAFEGLSPQEIEQLYAILHKLANNVGVA